MCGGRKKARRISPHLTAPHARRAGFTYQSADKDANFYYHVIRVCGGHVFPHLAPRFTAPVYANQVSVPKTYFFILFENNLLVFL